MFDRHHSHIRITVVGVGGAGGNAVLRMVKSGFEGVEFLALNTDVQALAQIKKVRTFAIGPNTTGGTGSGGRPEIGRRAIKESQEQIAQLLSGSEMVFVTAGMGGGTGTGAASVVAELARKQGALTVGVATLPFSFEGPHRRSAAQEGLDLFRRKVDTLIVVENERLLPALKGNVTVQRAFKLADDVLRQGVQGISEIVMSPGLINVDFADVRSVMNNGGPSFMALGEGKGRWAAIEAAHMALSNPLFDAPLEGATGVLLNVKGGKALTLGHVHEVADIVRKATGAEANINFGLVQERRLGSRVSITLVATGLRTDRGLPRSGTGDAHEEVDDDSSLLELFHKDTTNGHNVEDVAYTHRLL